MRNNPSGLTTHYYGGGANMAPKTPISGKTQGWGKLGSTTASTAKNTQKSASSKSYLEQYKQRNKKAKNSAGGAAASLSRLAASSKCSPPQSSAIAVVSQYN